MKFMPELSKNNRLGDIASRAKALGKTVLSRAPFLQQNPERRYGALAAAAGAALAVGGLIALNVVSRRKAMLEGPPQHIAFVDTAAPTDVPRTLSQSSTPMPAPVRRPSESLQ